MTHKAGGQCQWSGCSQPAVTTTRWPNGANARHCQEHHNIVLDSLREAPRESLRAAIEATLRDIGVMEEPLPGWTLARFADEIAVGIVTRGLGLSA
jgi:hypothetical protein